MVYQKMMANQLSFEVNHESTNVLNHATNNSFNRQHPIAHEHLYFNYGYQRYSHHHREHQENVQAANRMTQPSDIVLDLSVRCNSLESPKKTPSPHETNSSHSANSPSVSPKNNVQHHPVAQISSQSSTRPSYTTTTSPLGLPLALYPPMYCPPARSFGAVGANIKTEPPNSIGSTSPLTPPLSTTAQQSTPPLPLGIPQMPTVETPTAAAVATNFLHSFTASATLGASSTNSAAAPEDFHIKNMSIVDPINALIVPAIDAIKSTRPFKGYPRDPTVIAANFEANDTLYDSSRDKLYKEYRKRILEQIRESDEGPGRNPKMCRMESTSSSVHSNNNSESGDFSDCDSVNASVSQTENVTDTTETGTSNSGDNNDNGQVKDAAYYERRRKNNAAAKKSRDRRRKKEEELAARALYLERHNVELLCQLDILKTQIAAFMAKS